MAEIELKYGSERVSFGYDAERYVVLRGADGPAALTDVEIGERLDSPIGSGPLEDIVSPGETVLIVVPDATRQTGSGQIVDLVVRRLIANGTAPFDIRIIIAGRIHRRATENEKASIVTPFIAQRIKILDHDPRDLMQIFNFGETSGGIPIEINRAVVEHDRMIIIGGINFHYFAGFTGGRKLVCPGLASARTIAATHKLAFDIEKLARRDGVDTARLDGNAVHEAFMEIVEAAKPDFAISTFVDGSGAVTEVFCGDWRVSHQAACSVFLARNTVTIPEKRGLVIAACGGHPYDINIIQAHKSLDAAARACVEGGTIVLLAECRDGLGRADLMKWFEAADSRSLAVMLSERYQVNGQTAWSLLKKAESFDIRLITELDREMLQKMRLDSYDAASLGPLAAGRSGYIIPSASNLLIKEIAT